MHLSLDAAHTSGDHGWPGSQRRLRRITRTKTLYGRARSPRLYVTTHRLRIAPSIACYASESPPNPPPPPSPSVRTPAAHGVSRNLPRRSPRADLHPKKICNLGPIGPCPRQIRNHPRAPSSRRSGLVGPHTTPPIVNYKYMTSTLREGYFWLPTLGT